VKPETSAQAIKVSSVVQVSAEALADDVARVNVWAELDRLERMTPEERREAAEAARQARAEQRAATEPVPLILDALIDALGWSEAYARHVVQPYCTCRDSADGWETCQHAEDEGVAP
jgi:hypothetical protein